MARYTVSSLADLLAPTLGRDRASELVRETARDLRIDADELSEVHAELVLDQLAARPGSVGTAARFAARRALGSKNDDPPSSQTRESQVETASVRRGDIEDLLGETLGAEHARALVGEHWAKARLSGVSCTNTQALAILERIGEQPGLVGVTARFAKARWHLRHKR